MSDALFRERKQAFWDLCGDASFVRGDEVMEVAELKDALGLDAQVGAQPAVVAGCVVADFQDVGGLDEFYEGGWGELGFVERHGFGVDRPAIVVVAHLADVDQDDG